MEYKQRITYDINWFINFYSSKNNWCEGKLVKQNDDGSLSYDAIGFLHHDNFYQTGSWNLFLRKILLILAPNIISVNDNKVAKYNQSTPKERVLAYLTAIKQKKDDNKLYWDKQRELENLN